MKIRLAIEVQLPPLPHMAIWQSIRHIALAAKRLEVGFVAARSVRGGGRPGERLWRVPWTNRWFLATTVPSPRGTPSQQFECTAIKAISAKPY